MKTLAVCGLGGSGKEILDLIVRTNNRRWREIIFCDICVREDLFLNAYKVFTFEQIANNYTNEELEFVISFGDVYLRKKIYHQILEGGFSLATIIAPNVCIPQTTKIGKGVIVRDNCYISVDAYIDDNSMIQPNAVIGHDVRIGKNTIISSQSVIAGSSTVGNNTYIAIGCIIKELVNIGDNTIVSMGTVVNKDIESGVIVRGNPVEFVSRNCLKSAFRLNMRNKSE